VNDHAVGCDITDLKCATSATACTRGIARHQQDAMKGKLRRVNQTRDLLLAEYLRKVKTFFG